MRGFVDLSGGSCKDERERKSREGKKERLGDGNGEEGLEWSTYEED